MTYTIRTNIDPSNTSGTELADIVEEVSDLVQIVVESDTSNQPGSSSEGDAYIANGDTSWVNGSQYDLAVFRDSTWIYHTPEEGWVAYIKDRGEFRRFNGTNWNSRLPDGSPEHATDSGTDTFVSATNTDTPNSDDVVVRDFQSGNTTTTPTLDGDPITTRDGSPLWAGALSGVHRFQRAASSWLVLGPNPDLEAQKWISKAIGEHYYVDDSVTGADVPPTDDSRFKFIKLTAGLTGAGQYNEGLLTSESVSGSAPLVVATAVIDDPNSPMDGQTVHLLNTENRYLQPGTSPGTVANDQMQRITGEYTGNWSSDATAAGAIGMVVEEDGSQAGNGTAPHKTILFDSANSPSARTGDHTDVKHLEVTMYMRIR